MPHVPIATNATHTTPKPKTSVDEPESSSLLFFSALEAIFILVTSGRDSASEDKSLQIVSFAGCDIENCDAEVSSSRCLIFDAKGSLNLLEFDNNLPTSSSSTWLNSSHIRLERGGAGGQNKLFLMAATSCSPPQSVGVRSRRETRHALRSHFNLLLGHLILYALGCLIDP